MAFYAPRIWLWRKRQKRMKAFNDQLADGIALLANSLRSGYSLPQALELLSRDARPPLSHEFSRVNREVNLGLSPPDALANILNRVPSDDLDLFITARQHPTRGRWKPGRGAGHDRRHYSRSRQTVG